MIIKTINSEKEFKVTFSLRIIWNGIHNKISIHRWFDVMFFKDFYLNILYPVIPTYIT